MGHFLLLFIHLFGFGELVQTSNAFLLIFTLAYPEFFAVLHYVGEHGTAEEHHVLLARRVFDFDFEFRI